MLRLFSYQILFLIFLLPHCFQSQYVPPEASVQPLKPVGIRISIPRKTAFVAIYVCACGIDFTHLSFNSVDEEGISLVAFHVKFNDDFVGLEAGTIARDIIKQKGGRWTYEDRSTQLKKDDIIYYWIHVVYNGLGYNLVNQELNVTGLTIINLYTNLS